MQRVREQDFGSETRRTDSSSIEDIGSLLQRGLDVHGFA